MANIIRLSEGNLSVPDGHGRLGCYWAATRAIGDANKCLGLRTPARVKTVGRSEPEQWDGSLRLPLKFWAHRYQ